MEETGPNGAAKRQRLDVNGAGNSLRRPHEQYPESSRALPLHNYSQGPPLDPPGAYRPTVPNTPYPNGEAPPGPAEQSPHGGYAYGAPSHDQPPRGPRHMVDQPPHGYARPGNSTPVRSPDDGHNVRLPPSTSFGENEPAHYPHHPNSEMADGLPHISPHEAQRSYALPHMSHSQHEPAHGSHAGPPSLVYSEQEMVHGVPGQSAYGTASYGNTPTSIYQRSSLPQAQKRSNRAQQACDNCRQRKAKCDEGKPACSYCRENGQVCNYKEVQPAKADRAQKEIMDRLDQHQEQMGKARDMTEANQKAIVALDGKLDRILQAIGTKALRNDDDFGQDTKKGIIRSDISHPTTPKVLSPHATQDDQPMADYHTHEASYSNTQLVDSNEEKHPVQTTLGQAGAVAVDHSTGVHRLLSWPSINSIITSTAVVDNLKGRKLREDYVMEHETSKGVIRLYGRGQGVETYDGGSTGSCPSPALSSTSNSKGEDSARSPVASPPDIWGANLGPPNLVDGRFYNGTADDHPGGLNADGTLKVDKATMDSLLYSYLENIHLLHPFLDKTRLKRMFERFHAQSHPSEGHGSTRSPHMFNSITYPDPVVRPSRKRKLSAGESPRDASHSESGRSGPEPVVERRIWTAIVLLVMALGKICAHKEFLSGPVPDRERSRDMLAGSTSSPLNMDSPSTRTSSSRIGSPINTGACEGRPMHFNQRPSIGIGLGRNVLRPGDRNVDVIPGLAYYTKATEILGALHGGTELLHVQANLLASLYMGQLACSIEAWSWIYDACKSCLFLMRGRPFHGQKHERVQLILFAYWTCYQFESDILAELDLRPSGIESLTQGAESISYPQSIEDSLNDGYDRPVNNFEKDKVLYYYSSQINMRTALNQIQKLLYPKNGPANIDQRSWKKMLQYRNNCLATLQAWRGALPVPLQWSDHDPPANNILDARLRGKYWGTLYIITRPLLNWALQYAKEPSIAQKEEIMLNEGTPTTNWTIDIDSMEVMRTCKMCVFAAKQSTKAFDGLMGFGADGQPTKRPIVTNIFGTSHAQFGNNLVLAAVYRSHFQFLISKEELVSLLNRTIAFLTRLSAISNTLQTDASILGGILHHIEHPESTTTSFSSYM